MTAVTPQDKTLRLPLVSFGATTAIVTSVGPVVGFGSADVRKSAIISGLLIVGLADNLTDTLSIHIFQESELWNNVRRSARPSAIFDATVHCRQLCCPHAPAFKSTGDSLLSGVGNSAARLPHLSCCQKSRSQRHIRIDQAHCACSSGNRGERVDRSWIGNLMH